MPQEPREADEREAELAAHHVRELEASERRFHSAFTHASIGMALVVFDGRVLQVNAALRALLGVEADDDDRRSACSASSSTPSDAPTLQRPPDAAATRNRSTAFEIELRLRAPRRRRSVGALHGSFFAEQRLAMRPA